MADPRLIQFVRQSLARGFGYEQIRAYLLQAGWGETEVDKAIRATQGKGNVVYIALAALVVLIVFLGFILLLWPGDGKAEEEAFPDIDYSITLESSNLSREEALAIKNSFEAPTQDTLMVAPSYEVRASGGEESLLKWRESAAPIASFSDSVRKHLPGHLEDGDYVVIAEVDFGDQHIEDRARFSVYTAATCEDGEKNQGEKGVDCGGPCEPCPNCSDGEQNQGEEGIDCGGPCEPCETNQCGDCEDNDPCTKDFCENGTCVHEQQEPCCGNGKCEEGEDSGSCPKDCEGKQDISSIESEAKSLARKDVNEAGEYCDGLADQQKTDHCLKVVAHEAKEMDICDHIETTTTADYCYLKFGLEGDASVCSEIENSRLRSSCESMH